MVLLESQISPEQKERESSIDLALEADARTDGDLHRPGIREGDDDSLPADPVQPVVASPAPSDSPSDASKPHVKTRQEKKDEKKRLLKERREAKKKMKDMKKHKITFVKETPKVDVSDEKPKRSEDADHEAAKDHKSNGYTEGDHPKKGAHSDDAPKLRQEKKGRKASRRQTQTDRRQAQTDRRQAQTDR